MIVTTYNHTANLINSAANAAADTYKFNLYSTLPTNATATTKAAAESGATQIATANGYTQDAKVLTGVTISIVTTNDSRFGCDQIIWTASGGPIAAGFGLLYNDTDTNDPPLFRFDFEGTITAASGIPFVVEFPNGIWLLERT